MADVRRFTADGSRLRSPERLALMEVPRVVRLSTDGITAASALDVGTGTGVWAEAFTAGGLRVTGIDPNLRLLDEARSRVPMATFAEGTAEHLAFPDRSFDIVFFGHVLHETDQRLSVLREARRVAAQRVVVLEWPLDEASLTGGRVGPPPEHRIGADVVLALAREAGFSTTLHERLTHMDYFILTP